MAPKGRPSKLVAIYALSDATGAIRHVGKAIDPGKRFRQHLSAARRHPKTPLHSWLKREAESGRDATLSVLEWAPSDEWQAAERRLIALHRPSGKLLNIQDGGDQPQRSHDPIARRIWFIKKQMRIGLRAGYVNEATKAKMRLLATRQPERFGEWAAI